MRSLRTVILLRIIIVALISFVLSAAFTYYYYRTILIPQMIHEDETKLNQTVRQLEYMSDDIAKFSFSLIISNQLQSFYKSYDQLDTFDQFAMVQDTLYYLDDNKGLRKEVVSFALILPNDRVFWSEARNDSYFSEHLKEDWYQNFVRSGQQHAFTEPHDMIMISNSVIEGKSISFIVNVMDIEQPGHTIGELILNLDYDSFKSLLDFGSEDFEGLLWMNDAGYVLYEKENPSADTSFSSSLLLTASEKNQEGIFPISGGYMLIDRFETNHWKLATFISQASLMNRGKIIIYLLGFFSLTSTSLILLLMMPAIFRITRPIMRLYHAMNAVSSGNLQTSVHIQTGDELEKLGQGFNRMTNQLKLQLEESIRHEKDKRELELELLLSKLNPHFVYNTLNAVIYMAQKQGNDDIVRMVGSFIRILQDAVKMEGTQSLIPLREEIGLLRDYIAIQSYRYIDMFEVRWDIEEDAYDCLVPRNLIQPFIENAIFHGICPKEANGIIHISAAVSRMNLTIQIEDDGVGIEPHLLPAIWDKGSDMKNSGLRHIGLSHTKKRVEHLFGKQASLRIESQVDQGTVVSVELPRLKGDSFSQ
ncbi:two-component system sensor histidine kinase YesM [Paenibacillus castaneae]|uniref:sensor histidine kinase n=1 Tax=Paenibacillus castaneae TaxID=474957 RepID=UPI000C9B26B2|nr:histidine kinase [Paenibacillus castaneae]NIK78032.1 two-component system sensor histidine kinase YesM [Paenibacillus castaneae]